MVSLAALWLPIVVAAVLVFVVSSLVHMVLRYHNSDYRKLPDEAQTLDGLRKAALAPGTYTFPHCTHKDMGTPEMAAKFQQGPVGHMTVRPNGTPNLGTYLGAWFAYTLLVGVFVAYVGAHTLAKGAPYLSVFRVTGTAAFLAYGVSQLQDSIWKGQPGGTTLKHVFDGLLYALVSAGAFGWLWPR